MAVCLSWSGCGLCSVCFFWTPWGSSCGTSGRLPRQLVSQGCQAARGRRSCLLFFCPWFCVLMSSWGLGWMIWCWEPVDARTSQLIGWVPSRSELFPRRWWSAWWRSKGPLRRGNAQIAALAGFDWLPPSQPFPVVAVPKLMLNSAHVLAINWSTDIPSFSLLMIIKVPAG